jgi:uncharacterized 2Fe-2S/4Fe-4S cluster protein (DUF4445 family)
MIVQLKPDGNKTALELLREQGLNITADCSGEGRCGKCRIKVVEGDIPVTKEDMRFFDATKYLQGYRLACRAVVKDPVTVEIPDPLEAQILTSVGTQNTHRPKRMNASTSRIDIIKKDAADLSTMYASADIGTTSIVVMLYDAAGEVIATASAINPQRCFGADVVSRIQAARAGRDRSMRAMTADTLRDCLLDLADVFNADVSNIKDLVIVGNTAMLHILRGLDCNGLAAYPFKPVSLDFVREPGYNLLGNGFETATVIYFPGISAFVGADVVSGVYGLDLAKDDTPKLFIDMGTNGELVLFTKDGLTCSSSSAGPAFEGGELSCGMAGMTGAVESVQIVMDDDGRPGVMCKVIGGGHVKGLCGSGAMKLLSELVMHGFVDEDGTLSEEYFYDGFPFAETEDGTVLCMTQLDVRALQLAKSAIRAISELMLKSAGVEKPRIILAGGMGSFVEPEALKYIGMLPEGEISFAGNTALLGTKRFVEALAKGKETEAVKELMHIALETKEIVASQDPEFQGLFLEYMGFENAHR